MTENYELEEEFFDIEYEDESDDEDLMVDDTFAASLDPTAGQATCVDHGSYDTEALLIEDDVSPLFAFLGTSAPLNSTGAQLYLPEMMKSHHQPLI